MINRVVAALAVSARSALSALSALTILALMSAAVSAQTKPEPAADPRAAMQAEYRAAMEAVGKVIQNGPAEIKLLEQGVLKLPTAYAFIPAVEAGRLLRAMGNRPSNDLIGMVVPKDDADWFATLRYIASGYIKDDDAKDWKADELLDNIKTGTEQGNTERISRGLPEIEILGWVEKPAYDPTMHRLVWSLSSKAKGIADSDKGVNYNTYTLGREGYISLNWVTALDAIEREKPQARALLAALDFNEGKRYADFNSSTDRVAEFGLAALVAGVAAKKLGLLAVAGLFLAKFAKIIIAAVFVGGGGLFKFFRKKPDAP